MIKCDSLVNVFEMTRHLFCSFISERMAESIKEELMPEELEMKGGKGSIKENSSILTPIEDISTVYVQEEDVKMEGKIRMFRYIINSLYF